MAGGRAFGRGDRCGVVLSCLAASGRQSEATNAENRGAGQAGVVTAGASEQRRAKSESENVLGNPGAGWEVEPRDRRASPFERSRVARQTGAEYSVGRTRRSRIAYATTGCGAAGVLSAARWNCRGGFFGGYRHFYSFG